MKIEISHDTLAKTVFEKASTDDKMRLRVANLIHAKYQLHQERNSYLTADELKFIAPFEKKLTISAAESKFIGRSRILARKQQIILGLVILIFVSVLAWYMMSYRKANQKNKAAYIVLTLKQDSLAAAFVAIAQQNKRLVAEDSTQQALRAKIQDRESIINMTNTELQEALNDLQVANMKLEKKKKELEKERDKLRVDKRSLSAKLKTKSADHEKIKSALSVAVQSQKLSQNAQEILTSNNKPSSQEFKEAFRLARAAWEMSKSNSQAMDVLNKINNFKMEKSNGEFLNNTRPKYTYTYRKVEAIIKNIDKKYNYGKLSKSEIKSFLRK